MSDNNIKIAKLEEIVGNVSKGVDEIKDVLKEHIVLDNEYHEKINDKFDAFDEKINKKFDKLDTKLDKRYANKWVEGVVKTLIGAGITTIFGLFLYYITK